MARRSGRRRSFGYLRRLPGGNMQASYVGPDGQRHTASSTFVDGGYAQGWLADERRLISDGRWTPPAVRQAEQIAQAAREDAMAEDHWHRSRPQETRPRESGRRRAVVGPAAQHADNQRQGLPAAELGDEGGPRRRAH